MNLSGRISSFELLGNILRSFPDPPAGFGKECRIISDAAEKAEKDNPWFTHDQVTRALNSLGDSLRRVNLEKWLEPYLEKIGASESQYTVGVVMAGNIPAVGFHDLLCVLISGNRLTAKLSAQDRHLLPGMVEVLKTVDLEWNDLVTWSD